MRSAVMRILVIEDVDNKYADVREILEQILAAPL